MLCVLCDLMSWDSDNRDSENNKGSLFSYPGVWTSCPQSGGLVLRTSGYLEMGCCSDLVGCWLANVLDTFSPFLGRVYP